jgi:hypothetical protein
MSEPIGSVTYGNGSVVAELWGRDNWQVYLSGKENPGMARGLKAMYADTYNGPSDGYYGQLILNDLAGWTGGTMTIRDFPPAGPNEIP